MKKIIMFWLIIALIINTLIFGWNSASWLIAVLLMTPTIFKIIKYSIKKARIEG